MKSHILVLADDAALRAMLAKTLLQSGYAVELANTPRRARDILASETIALTILAPRDLGPAAIEFAADIEKRKAPLVIVAESADEIVPQEIPERSYTRLARPFSDKDLLAVVKAGLNAPRPSIATQQASPLLKFEGFTLDRDARFCIDAAGRQLTLTRAEFSLLAAFAQQPGRVHSRDELTFVVAGRGAEPDDRSVDVLISRLRRKIEADPKAPKIILTVPGEGYRFAATPEQVMGGTPAAAPEKELVVAAPAAGDPTIPPAAIHGAPARRLWIAAATLAILATVFSGWTLWKYLSVSRAVQQVAQTVSSLPPQQPPGPQQRDLVFKRMMVALQDDRYTWRTIERLAVEAGVDEGEAHAILAEHSSEVVLGKSHDGKLIARLTSR